MEADRAAALYQEHAGDLGRFVRGLVGHPDEVSEVMQATFARLLESGHEAREETVRGWLFRVALNEVRLARRQAGVRERGRRRLAELMVSEAGETAEGLLMREEGRDEVRRALQALPEKERRIVMARIHEDKTFAEIAEEQGLPLGTVLTRMRRALGRLRRVLERGERS